MSTTGSYVIGDSAAGEPEQFSVSKGGSDGNGLALRKANRSMFQRHKPFFLGTLGVVLLLAAWQICADLKVIDTRFASSPWLVAKAGYRFVQTAAFRTDIASSGEHFIMGFACAVIIGVTLGVALGQYRNFNYLMNYVISFAYAAPTLALIPLLVVWFGIGAKTDVVIITIISTFPVLISTMNGIRTVDRNLIEMARSMNVSQWRMLHAVMLPAAVPSIMSGIRLAVGTSLVGVVVSEFLAATSGIGYMINYEASLFQTADVFVGLAIISISGVVITEIFRVMERHFDKWRV